MDDCNLTKEQKDIAYQLLLRDKPVQTAYYGCIHAIKQKEYPDRLVHFAHSLREVIDLLAKRSLLDSKRHNNFVRNEREKYLMKTFDPKNERGYSENCQKLAKTYSLLSKVAHHCDNNESIYCKLSFVENILLKMFKPQTNVNHNFSPSRI